MSIGGQRDYAYDSGGNLLRLPTLPSTITPHYSDNPLQRVGNWQFTYTPNGERARETRNPVAGYQGDWGYTYDVWGNLTHVDRNGQLVYEAEYDAFGNRVWTKVGNEVRYYLYEGDTLVAELDTSGNLIAEYVWGLLGPIARVGCASGFPVPTARVQHCADSLSGAGVPKCRKCRSSFHSSFPPSAPCDGSATSHRHSPASARTLQARSPASTDRWTDSCRSFVDIPRFWLAITS